MILVLFDSLKHALHNTVKLFYNNKIKPLYTLKNDFVCNLNYTYIFIADAYVCDRHIRLYKGSISL